MRTALETMDREFASGEVVEPGVYIDVESGAIVKINETDELPDGSRMVRYLRRFRRLERAACSA